MIIKKKNKWELDPKQLNSCTGLNEEEGDILEDSPQWFKYNDKNTMSGDTVQEKNEMKQAIKDQVNLGIIKVRKNKTPKVQKEIFNKDFNSFKNKLKESPNNIKSSNVNSYRPKIRDTMTGKVRKLGPNDKCPCGSGKKFKKCHGRGQF